jgi:uncharacterized protein (TIGR02246 family)
MPADPKEVVDFAHNYAMAWCSGAPDAVALYYAEDGEISVNRGETSRGRAAIAEMAAGFYAEFPDLVVLCDEVRVSGNHAVFVWTLEGHHAQTKNFVRVGGWEEWELGDELKIKSSRGWFDAADYDAQIAGDA